ncbi:hypothetical protein D3C86_1759700 [compost metagenome]
MLLSKAAELEQVDAAFKEILSPEKIRSIVSLIPDDWLSGDQSFESIEAHREVYSRFLELRIAKSEIFLKEAQNAREKLI